MIGHADDTPPENEIRFGAYQATRIIGRGGMGTVYEAVHPTLGKRVALKVINGTLVGDPIASQRFLREATALAKLSHPHIVQVFDQGIEGGRPFIVMELLEGETLEQLLAREGRLPVARAVEIMLPILSAVAAIHDTATVHRDLKPGNILVARRGRFATEPVILDFGISLCHEPGADEGVTGPDVLLGTMPYLPPEQMRDARAAEPRGDQYALGVLLYECVTGQKPFTRGDRYEQMHAAMTAVLPPPSSLEPAVATVFDDIVLRAMNRTIGQRFPTTRALGSALLSFADAPTWKRWAGEFAGAAPDAGQSLSGHTVADVPRPTGPTTPPAAASRPFPRVALWGAALALVIGVALAIGARVRGPDTATPVERQPPMAAPAIAPAPAPPPVAPAPTTAPAPSKPLQVKRPSHQDDSRKQRPARPADQRTNEMNEPGDDDAINPFAPLR